ncbi:hypothetical protein PPOP_3442, partial [Paenibacillus popilliae ATCC 14706]
GDHRLFKADVGGMFHSAGERNL